MCVSEGGGERTITGGQVTARSTFTPKSRGLSAPSLGPPRVTPSDRRCPCPAWPKTAAGHTTSGGFGSTSRPWVFLPARGRSPVLYVQVGSICCPCPLNLKMGPGSFCRDRNRSQEGTGAHRPALLTTLTPLPPLEHSVVLISGVPQHEECRFPGSRAV